MEKNKNFRDRENGRIIGGLILVAVGSAFLLDNIGFFIPRWIFSWPMILILIGTYTGFKSNFRNNSWFVLMAIGGFFLVSENIPELNLMKLWPILIIGMGVMYILLPRRNKWTNSKTDNDYNKWEPVPVESVDDATRAQSFDSSDYLVVDSVFSGVNRNLVSKDFRGGHITSVFGGSKIDLSQADITGVVVIKLDIVFGGTKLVIPPHWTLQNQINGAFHGVDDKRKFHPSAAINPDKVLVLKGSVVFGGIEITSY